MSDKPKLMLLDGHSLAYRAFFALPVENFSTTTGQPTNAVYGFTAMLINAIRDEQPTHLGVAFDVSRQTFRSATYPAYKGNRTTSPDEFKGQVEFIKEVLAAMDILTAEVPGYEADDVIATLATQAQRQGFEVVILSGDRDVFQLVTDDVTVLYPRRGVSDLSRMTPGAVLDRYKIPPEQYPDLAAIVGESSDNLPGVPGVGPGFAAKWLIQYGSLAAVVDHADEITGKKGEALREHLAQVLTNRQVNALVLDLPLSVTVPELERPRFDRAKIHEVFDTLQFRVLRDRLFDYLESDVASAGDAIDADVEVVAPGRTSDWLLAHAAAGPVGVAFAGRFGSGTGEIRSVALATTADVGWIDLDTATGDDESALARWFADPDVAKDVHDAKGWTLALRARGWHLGGLQVDTAMAAYLALPGQRSFDLADLTARFLRRELAEASGDDAQLTLDGAGAANDAQSLGVRARAIRELADTLRQMLADRGGIDLLEQIEQPLAFVLADMEINGIAVDVPHFRRLEQDFAQRVADAEVEAHEIAGRPFNLGSPKQLQEILFGERALPKTKRIKTGYTTDAEALLGLYAKTQDPLLETLLLWRDASRLRQTVAGLIPVVDAQSRIHTTFNQIVAATGRLSSQDPNLQNIPIRTDDGRRIRAGFVVGQGFETLMTADYSQIEMRIMAHLSQDEGLIAAFRSGEDLHNTVASKVFEVPTDRVTPEMRRRIKAMSYGLAYGLSAYGLGLQLGVTPEEAKALMDDYFDRFGGIRDYLHEVVERARVAGYTETMLGRRRYLPDLTSDNRQRRQMAERMALNAPIQGSAADIIKIAMIKVDSALRRAGLRSRMVLQVHDELVIEVAPGESEAVTALVHAEMGGAVEMSVPMQVSTGVGADWEQAAH